MRRNMLAKIPLLAVCSLALVTGVAAGQKAGPIGFPSLKEIHRWKKVNQKPVKMPERLIAFCRPVTPWETAPNPHRGAYFTVYTNKTASAVMRAGRALRFPRGSVIVKEKLPAPRAKRAELLTVMVKRKKGYDPSGGDWEYAVLSGGAEKAVESGRLPHCKSCHANVRGSDYVFATYR